METKLRLNVAAGDINFALKQENEEDKHDYKRRRTSTIIQDEYEDIYDHEEESLDCEEAFRIMNRKL